MFEYNYYQKTKGMYVNLPMRMKFDYEFHDDISEMIDKCLLRTDNNIDCIYVTCDRDSEYDKMCQAYLLNVLRYMAIYKEVKWHKTLADKVVPMIHFRDGGKFSEVDFDKELKKTNLIYYDFHGDKDVQKPVDEMAKLLLYLQQGVVLGDYAEALHIPERKLSVFINSTYGVSFKRWVNNKRVEYATEQMAKHPDYTMERIAELSGFAHKSHFCKIFREITGGSFTEYKNR